MNKDVAELVAENMKSEADALRLYIKLKQALIEANDEEGAKAVDEIMSDEKNHSNMLQVIMLRHDGGVGIAKDNMEKTFDFLKKKLV